jgi:hypothetical protein
MTPLEKILGEIIAAEGPTVDRYMASITIRHGYYMTRSAASRGISRREISRLFGD